MKIINIDINILGIHLELINSYNTARINLIKMDMLLQNQKQQPTALVSSTISSIKRIENISNNQLKQDLIESYIANEEEKIKHHDAVILAEQIDKEIKEIDHLPEKYKELFTSAFIRDYKKFKLLSRIVDLSIHLTRHFESKKKHISKREHTDFAKEYNQHLNLLRFNLSEKSVLRNILFISKNLTLRKHRFGIRKLERNHV